MAMVLRDDRSLKTASAAPAGDSPLDGAIRLSSPDLTSRGGASGCTRETAICVAPPPLPNEAVRICRRSGPSLFVAKRLDRVEAGRPYRQPHGEGDGPHPPRGARAQ